MRRAASAALLLGLGTLAACKSAGGVGDILAGVLGGGQAQGAQGAQVAGTIAGVDTRAQQIGLQQGNGQTVGLGYDANTKVVFEGQLYAVTNLEAGDQVVARVLDQGNGAYYTDSVHVTRSVGPSGGATAVGGSGTVQQLQGVVRQIDRANGLFTLDLQGGVILTVSMPYQPRSTDVTRFQNLRAGESVRLAGVYLNNTRVELRQFY
jgi:hypothetical protein